MRNHRWLPGLMVPLLGMVLGACGVLSAGQEIQPTPYAAYAAVPDDSVEVHDITDTVPAEGVPLAKFTVPDSMESHTDDQLITAYRARAARLGATWITVDPAGGRRRVLAYHVPASVRIRRMARDSEPRPAATSAPAVSSGSGPVHVRGYRRRDGTYVRPHTRSRGRRN
jgi:hypothetical protein